MDDYKKKYIDKISEEATEFVANNIWPSPALAYQGMMQFIKRRAKHYGVLNKYPRNKEEKDFDDDIIKRIKGSSPPTI